MASKKRRASSVGKSTRRKVLAPRLSRGRRPDHLAVEEWQTALRRQFGREQSFVLENTGEESVFSEFSVTNPASGNNYRVAIRGTVVGENFCSCPDFATNGLGTCKHIEFTLGRIEKQRGGKAALQRGFHPRYSEVYLQYGSVRHVRFRAGSRCPPALVKQAKRIFRTAAEAEPVSADDLERLLAGARKAGHEVRCYEDVLAFIAQVRDADDRRRILDDAYPDGVSSARIKGLLKVELYPYQVEGALFAARAGRSMLGDEMGLGKTIQAIAAVELFAKHFGAERVLVVCPTSLKHQWQREIARFSGREALVINGPRALRQAGYRQHAFCKIANYDTLDRDRDLIQAWSPDIVIVDEAQRIKNWNTVAARALKRIESPYAIVLTGTPLENRIEELISIVQFVDQHCLGPTWKLLHEHQMRDETGRVIGYRDLDRIGRTLAPIFLRRRKAEVLEQLPARVDNTIFVPMTEQQRAHHDENGDTVARIVQRWRKTGYLSDADQRRLTCALQNMRMSCNSTYLLDKKTDYGAKADELVTLLGEVFERADAKVVVFSQWVRTHELIIRRLEARRWSHVLFHGGVPSEQRGALVDRFRDDPACRVFLSTDAGGVGLNLQHAASTVINMDLPWNPAVLEQRIGRVHRMGQTRSVQVVNFVAEGTIEEGMLTTLAFKRSLFAGVLDGGEKEIFLNGTRLAKFMESVDAVTNATTVEAPGVTPGQVADSRSASAAVPSDKDSHRSVESPTSAAPTQGSSADARQPVPSLASASTAEASREAVTLPQAAAPVSSVDSFAALLNAGLKLVETLSGEQRSGGAGHSNGSAPWIETDAQTGRSWLKLPIPEPQAVQRLTEALAGLIAGLRR